MDKIVCLGKNYLEHAKELAKMSGDSIPEKPVIFIKPPSVLVDATSQSNARLPVNRGDVHHETEIVLKIGKRGFNISKEKARDYVTHVSLGLDMTLREEQAVLKKKGHPWTTSKVFPDSAIVGPWVDAKKLETLSTIPFTLTIDGKIRQTGKATDMIFNWEACVSHASQFMELLPGDFIFTGTPHGVASVTVGNKAVLNWGDIAFSITWIALKN